MHFRALAVSDVHRSLWARTNHVQFTLCVTSAPSGSVSCSIYIRRRTVAIWRYARMDTPKFPPKLNIAVELALWFSFNYYARTISDMIVQDRHVTGCFYLLSPSSSTTTSYELSIRLSTVVSLYPRGKTSVYGLRCACSSDHDFIIY